MPANTFDLSVARVNRTISLFTAVVSRYSCFGCYSNAYNAICDNFKSLSSPESLDTRATNESACDRYVKCAQQI